MSFQNSISQTVRNLRVVIFSLGLMLAGANLWADTAPDQVNINEADAKTIALVLTGVGEVKARAIVAFRDKQGPFKAVDDLVQVRGVGQELLAKNRQRISIE